MGGYDEPWTIRQPAGASTKLRILTFASARIHSHGPSTLTTSNPPFRSPQRTHTLPILLTAPHPAKRVTRITLRSLHHRTRPTLSLLNPQPTVLCRLPNSPTTPTRGTLGHLPSHTTMPHRTVTIAHPTSASLPIRSPHHVLAACVAARTTIRALVLIRSLGGARVAAAMTALSIKVTFEELRTRQSLRLSTRRTARSRRRGAVLTRKASARPTCLAPSLAGGWVARSRAGSGRGHWQERFLADLAQRPLRGKGRRRGKGSAGTTVATMVLTMTDTIATTVTRVTEAPPSLVLPSVFNPWALNGSSFLFLLFFHPLLSWLARVLQPQDTATQNEYYTFHFNSFF
ncbi:hypothetical protein BDY21DRAFT_214024 [Lineolata rhizophorae]|uniref:Uncharacterized protein n=1 Tax=Lineolata rhizophorae TaxID=578093 RepID=A0A6A6P327_9PEZI|nr:hypothetical protein BDY21DRAFT_214024 [Lineolata rhizophorae]